MIPTEIFIAVLGFLGTLAGAYFANKKMSALIAYRLEQLEKKVQSHNNLVDRMYEAEKDIALVKDDVKEIKHKLQ